MVFHSIIIQPLINILFLAYSLVPGHDFGVSIILLTLVIRFALWPLVSKQLHSQKALNAIQPEANKLKEKFKDDPTKFNAALMELYKEKEVSPFSSCLPTLLQLPILFGIFYAISAFKNPAFLDLTNQGGVLKEIYPFLKDWGPVKDFILHTKTLSTGFLGMVDLAKPFIFFGILAGATQFVQSKMLIPKQQEKDASTAIASQMTYMFPVLTVLISFSLPAALPLYWTVTTLFAIGQQWWIMHREVETIEEKTDGNKKERKKNRRTRK